jgi:holo-[acyl-carrier protein] synthase
MLHPVFSIIGQLARMEPSQLQPEWSLDRLGLNSSLGLGVLRSALERRFGRRLGTLTWRTTLAEVVAAVDAEGTGAAPADGESPGQIRAAADPVSGPFGGRQRNPPALVPPVPALGHGIDLQEIAALPPWNAGPEAQAFYCDHFTAAERTAAEQRPDPRAHLCGVWCAKEAIRKSDPELCGLGPAEIAVESGPTGKPCARLLRPGWPERFAIALSISHSANYAVASAITQRR